MERFTVIGAGSGGMAMAGDMARKGHAVCLYNRSAARLNWLAEARGIVMQGCIQGLAPLAMITSDLRAAAEFAKVLLIIVPAYAHASIAQGIAPYLRDDQIVVLCPGRTGGALEFGSVLRKQRPACKTVIAETQTIVHTCRSSEEGASVHVFGVKRSVPIAALPAQHTRSVVAALSNVLPQLMPAENVLVTSLANVGAILHPAPTLLNTGWIESLRTEFLYYYEGITPSISSFLEELDGERLRIANAFGLTVPSVTEWMCDAYGATGMSLYDAVQSNPAYREIYAPVSINHRYIYEDVPTGLVPMSRLAEIVGVSTPNIDSLVNLSSRLCQVDFWSRGRSLRGLGLEGLGAQGVLAVVGERGLL